MISVYDNPTRRIVTNGAMDALPEWIKKIGAQRVLIVLGAHSFRESQAFTNLQLSLSGLEVKKSIAVPENPSISFVEDFCERYRPFNAEVVAGIGGGSVIDVAKVTSVLLTRTSRALREFIDSKKDFLGNRLPLAAVPTTSGTGSEVTPYASLQTEQKKKITVTHRLFFPDLAILDPELTHSMPALITASTGFDALSQAIEAFWAVKHTPFSDTHALRAASLSIKNLAAAVRDPLNREARAGMMLAACESGLAIAITATTAVHSVSYPITTFFGVPHGHACALTLAEFIRFNESSMKEHRYHELWRALDANNAGQAADRIEALMTKVGLERQLRRLGIDEKGVERIIENGFRPDRVLNNPKPLDSKSLKEMLCRIF